MQNKINTWHVKHDMCDHLEPLSWRPGQSQERWERPTPGLAEAELDELELELEEEVEGLEEVAMPFVPEVDLVVELYEETMEFLGDEVCKGRGAGSESEPDE